MTAKIRVIDIGGGLPVDYKHDEPNHIALTYAKALRAEVPALFSGEFTVLTEMGRYIVATSGWFASRIEYTKVAGGRLVGITHAGGNMFVREVYMRDTWYHPITIYDSTGHKKTENEQVVDIAGPAYSISMYSMYNCIQAPPAYFYSIDPSTHCVMVEQIKKQQSVEDISSFWDA